jgi:hypothetical protein
MRRPDLILRESRISLEQEGTDLSRPEQIYDFLVGQDGISVRSAARNHHDEKYHSCPQKTQAPVVEVAIYRYESASHGSDSYPWFWLQKKEQVQEPASCTCPQSL